MRHRDRTATRLDRLMPLRLAAIVVAWAAAMGAGVPPTWATSIGGTQSAAREPAVEVLPTPPAPAG